jgi:hypothetical protein
VRHADREARGGAGTGRRAAAAGGREVRVQEGRGRALMGRHARGVRCSGRTESLGSVHPQTKMHPSFLQHFKNTAWL